MIRVLVAATNNIVCAGLSALLSASPELTVVGSSVGVATLAVVVEDLQPDVVLVELGLHDDAFSDKLLPLSVISQHVSAIVVLTDDSQIDWAIESLRLGVRAVLPRSEAKADEIVAAIFAAAAGLIVLHSGVVDSLLSVLPSAVRELPTSPLMALTPREIEVLSMLAEGLGNKTLARRLSISEHTVKFHVSSIFTKLNAKSRTEAVTLGARHGLIML